MMSGLCTYMNTARASLSVLWPQCSCCKWGHPRSLEVTRGHQSPAWAEVARGPEAVNTHSASSLGAHSAISGLSLGPACSLPPPSLSELTRAAERRLLSSMSRLGPGQLLVRCPGEDRGWSARGERGVHTGHQDSDTEQSETQELGAHYTALSWHCHASHYNHQLIITHCHCHTSIKNPLPEFYCGHTAFWTSGSQINDLRQS